MKDEETGKGVKKKKKTKKKTVEQNKRIWKC